MFSPSVISTYAVERSSNWTSDQNARLNEHERCAPDHSPSSLTETTALLAHDDTPFHASEKNSWTPLHRAAFAGDLRMCTELHNKGASLLTCTGNGDYPANLAERGGHHVAAGMLNLLAEVEALDQNSLDDLRPDTLDDCNPADFVPCNTHEVCTKDNFSNSCTFFDRTELLQELPGSDYGGVISPSEIKDTTFSVAQGAKVPFYGYLDTNWTPLHRAAFAGDLQACVLHHSSGASMFTRTITGDTPANLAQKGGHYVTAGVLEMISALESRNQNLLDLDLKQFASKNDAERVRQKLLNGARINSVDYAGRTALHIACELGYADVAEVLLRFGADRSIRDRNGMTAVGKAKFCGHEHIARSFQICEDPQKCLNLLRMENEDVRHIEYPLATEHTGGRNSVDYRQALQRNRKSTGKHIWERLHIAAMAGDLKKCASLHCRGASLLARSNAGYTPAELAQRAGHYVTASMLQIMASMETELCRSYHKPI